MVLHEDGSYYDIQMWNYVDLPATRIRNPENA